MLLEYSEPPHCVNPLSVSISCSGQFRLILDLRHVNSCRAKRKVKFEGTVESLAFAKKGNYMLNFDITSGYHHGNMHPDYFTYLEFSWKF